VAQRNSRPGLFQTIQVLKRLQALWRAGKPVVVGDAESDVEPETDDVVGVPIEKVQVYI